jgi:hypothetical protein
MTSFTDWRTLDPVDEVPEDSAKRSGIVRTGVWPELDRVEKVDAPVEEELARGVTAAGV